MMAALFTAIAADAMWNLTPEYLTSVKEELKGRRAAVQARVADELKAIEADLEEVENLERVAYAFAVKHLTEGEPASSEAAPQERVVVAALQSGSAPADPVAAEPASESKGASRWRIRLDSKPEAESA